MTLVHESFGLTWLCFCNAVLELHKWEIRCNGQDTNTDIWLCSDSDLETETWFSCATRCLYVGDDSVQCSIDRSAEPNGLCGKAASGLKRILI